MWVLIPSNKKVDLKEFNYRLTDKSKILDWEIIDYKKIIDNNIIEKITFLEKQITYNLITLNIRKVEYFKIENELHIITNNNHRLIYDLSKNLKEQIDKTILLYNKKWYKKVNFTWLVYVDFRLEDKVFLCEQSEEQYCKKNLFRIYWIKDKGM